MASFMKPNSFTLIASATAIAQFKAVKLNGTDNTVAIAGAGEDAIGFTKDAVLASAGADIAMPGGGALATAGGTINAGARLKVDSAGDLVTADTDGDLCVAVALQDAVDGDVFSVFVEHVYLFVAA